MQGGRVIDVGYTLELIADVGGLEALNAWGLPRACFGNPLLELVGPACI